MAAPTDTAPTPQGPPLPDLNTSISEAEQANRLGTGNLDDPRIDPNKPPDPNQIQWGTPQQQQTPQSQAQPQQQVTPLTEADFELPKEAPKEQTPAPKTTPIAAGSGTTELPVPEGQKPLTEADFKTSEHDELAATIAQGNQDLINSLSQKPRDQIFDQYNQEKDAGHQPDPNLYAQALQKQAQDEVNNALPTSAADFGKKVGERAAETGQLAGQLATGTVKGFSGLGDSLNGLKNTVQSAANETGVAMAGVAANPNASVELRGILEKNKAQMNPAEYQRQSDLILQLAGVENQIKQSDLAELHQPNIAEANQLKGSIDQLFEQKKALIAQINPDYSNYRQVQAQRNVGSGIAHGVVQGVDQLGRAGTWLAYNSPLGIPLKLYDAHRDLQSWQDELEDHYANQQQLNDLASGKDITLKGAIPSPFPGSPQANQPFEMNLLPGNLQEMQAHGYGGDPQKIRDVSDAFQLGATSLLPMDLGVGDLIAPKILGGLGKITETAVGAAGKMLTKSAKAYGPLEIMGGIMEGIPKLAGPGGVGAFAGHVAQSVGIPVGTYALGKVTQAATKVAGDFFAKAASDSWKTGGLLPNMARRLTAEAINAPIESVGYGAITSDNPEQFAQNVTTLAALRAGLALPKEGLGAFKNFWVDKYFGGAKNAPTPYQDYAPHAALDQGELNDLNATSKETLASVPADQQNAANATRQFVGPEAQIHFAPTDEWDAYQKKYAPNSQGVSSRGFYVHEFPSQDLLTPAPKMIFIRGDSIPDALGWETGRLLHSLMPDDIQQRFNAAAAGGMHGGMDAFTQNYIRDLVGRGQGDLSQYPRFQDLPTEEEVANGAQPGPAGLTRDLMLNAAGADTARRILNGQSISQLLKDPTGMRSLRQGVAWMADKMGFPLSSDVNPDTFDGVSPGIPGSIIMEQWMRQFGRRLTTYPFPEPEIGTGAASPSGRPPSSGPVGGRPTPGPQPNPPMPAAGTPQGRTFTPSTDWQPHPGPNVVLPGGGGFQHRTVGGELQVRWNNPPNVQVQVAGTPTPQEQKEPAKVTKTTAPTEGLPPVEPEKAPTPKTLDRPAVFDRIMRSEGRGSTEGMEQGQHELYGFRDRDDPEAYRAISEARARYGVGTPEERDVVHQYLEKEYNDAGGDKFTNPAVQALVASMAHMRGAGGARAMIQAISDGTIRKSFNDLPQSSIDAINNMSPEEAIAKLSNVRERYDRLVYGDTPTEGGGTWWQAFGNGLRNRYAREANEALGIAGGSPEVYRVHSELARAQTYGAARGEGFEGPGGTRSPTTATPTSGEEMELGRMLMDPQTLREEAAKGNNLARHLLEEQHGPNWTQELSPEQQANYAALEGEDYADQQRRLIAEGAYPQRRSATQALNEQAPVLRQIQDAGGFSTAAKTWVEPNAEDIAEAHAAFTRLSPEYRNYLRQNFGITQQKLFNASGTPLEDIPGRIGNSSLRTGQDILDHYYATLSNLDRMHQGLPALEYGQTPEVSQNVPHGTGTRTVPALTAEQVQATLRAAAESVPTTTARGRARDTNSQAYQNEVEAAKNEALLQAHASGLEPGDDRVQLYRDPDTGQVSASGNRIVPGDLAHDLLTEGIDPAEIALANRFGDMARGREPVTMTYRSAARTPEAASTERQVREAEQGASPAEARAHGEAPSEDLTKSWVPSRISIAGLGKPGKKSIILHGLSTDKIAQNIAHIQEALPASHLAKDMSKAGWAEAVSRYVENHQHGYSGDGSKALQGTDKVPVKVDSHYHTKPLPAEIAQVINMAMGDPGARGTTEKAAAAREFAQRNEGYLSPEGEVNPLREEIDRTSQAYQTAQPLWHDKLTSPWETLRADLVQDVHSGHEEGPGRMREGSEGLDQAVHQYGMPRGQFVRAGFMPEGRGTLEEKYPKAKERVDGRLVGDHIPNTSSISSTLENYKMLPGIREVPMHEFDQAPPLSFYSPAERERTEKLSSEISDSGRIDPLIVAEDNEGPYILEGGHRFDALRMLGAKSFPAIVARDLDSLPEETPPHRAGFMPEARSRGAREPDTYRLLRISGDVKFANSYHDEPLPGQWMSYDNADAGPVARESGPTPRAAFMPEDVVGASRNPQVDDPRFKRWFGKSKVVDRHGDPLRLYHGTTHDFSEHDVTKTNPESDWGRGVYMSNEPHDVNANYAGFGPDLTNRIVQRAEDIMQESAPEAKYGTQEYVDAWESAKEKAKSEIGGQSSSVQPLYASIKKPLEIGGPDHTEWSYKYNERTGSESGDIPKFAQAVRDVFSERGLEGADDAIAHALGEDVYPGEPANAGDIIKRFRESDPVSYALDYESERGQNSPGQLAADVIRKMGHDGVIDNTVDEKFGSSRTTGAPMGGVGPDTTHVVAFDPSQVKSAIGNRGTFSRKSPNVTFMPDEPSIDKRLFPSDSNKLPAFIPLAHRKED